MIRNTLIAIVCLGTSVALIPDAAMAAEPAVYTSWRNNVGAGGFDVVSFYSGVPLKGNDEFAADYMGAKWKFSSRANMDLFTANPEAFAPQYGGYCAWAIAEGKLAKGSPNHWTVEDGKLYLNFNSRIKTRWESDKANFITQGDENWPSILNE